MICPNCSSKVPDGMKFCTVCGKKLPSSDAESEQRYCVRCGQPCEPGHNLCRECRAKKAAAKAAAAGGAPVKKKKRKKSNPLITVLIVLIVLLVLLCAFGVWLLFGHSVTGSGEVTEVTSASEGLETDSSGYTRIRDDSSDQDESAAADAEPEAQDETAPEEVTYVSTYQIIAGDVSWKEANAACEEMGGHLAVITSEEEYETVCALADESGLTYLWLGSHITDASQDYAWDDGEEWTFEKWYPDEPSKADLDGTQEYYLCLWNAKHDGEEIGWTFNDQRSDIAGDFASVSGLVGYICEIEVPEN